MATVREVADLVEELFPPENVCMDDFIGLMLGREDAEIDRVVVCLDCTEAVVEEAARKGAKLILTHHPLIFGGITSVTDQTPTGRIILRCIEQGISVFSAHTNMDCSKGGINAYLADILGLENAEILVENPNGRSGVGYIGDLMQGTTLRELAEFVGDELSDDYVKPYGTDELIFRVAVINGAGGDIEYIDEAKKRGADCLITSEIKHHVALYATAQGVNLIETGHYASERIFIKRLTEMLNSAAENIMEIQFITSEYEKNPAL